jgi:hypothetical protein
MVLDVGSVEVISNGLGDNEVTSEYLNVWRVLREPEIILECSGSPREGFLCIQLLSRYIWDYRN